MVANLNTTIILGYFNPNNIATAVNYRGIFITLATGAYVIKQIPR